MHSRTALFITSIVTFAATVCAGRIPLPRGFLIEGVTHVAQDLFVGSNVRTAELILFDSKAKVVATITRPPPGVPERSAFGVHYDRRSGLLFVAGGGPGFIDFQNGLGDSGFTAPFNYTPAVHVYALSTGRQVASCELPNAGFLNDITMTADRRYVYVTDSVKASLVRMKVSGLPGCVVDTVPLPPSMFSGDNFFATGIQPYRNGLLVNNFGQGGLFFVDLFKLRKNNAPTVTRVLTQDDLPFPDGLRLIAKRWLFSASVFSNIVYQFRLSFDRRSRTVSAIPVRQITSPDFSEISAVASWNRTLVVTNMNVTAFSETRGRLWIATVDLRV